MENLAGAGNPKALVQTHASLNRKGLSRCDRVAAARQVYGIDDKLPILVPRVTGGGWLGGVPWTLGGFAANSRTLKRVSTIRGRGAVAVWSGRKTQVH